MYKKVGGYTAAREARLNNIYPYFRAISSAQDTEVEIDQKKVLMFGSNSYLGLTNHPEVIEAAVQATRKYGTGCAGSRFLNGTLDIHLELEERLASFIGKERVIVFSTGFQANLGVLSSLAGRHDYIIMDDLSHASLLDGARLSFGKVIKFRHNDVSDLEQKLQRLPAEHLKIIVTEGVFSMEGDIAKLEDIQHMAKV